ncbi:MAG: DNA/RNA helicase domain-containing protein, partial [Candidatus Methanomethylicaceae archaeon]
TPSEIVSPGYQRIWGLPSQSQVDAWNNSLKVLVDSLSDPIFDDILAVIELQMPVGAERADCVLLGGTESSPKAVVIELKQWANIYLMDTGEVNVLGHGIFSHPSIQALNYHGKLRFFNAIAKNYEISCCAFLHNASENDRNNLSAGIASEWVKKAPILIRPKEMAKYIKDKLLPASLPLNEAINFANAPFAQSQHLFDFIKSHADAILNDFESVLAETGMGLTNEQREIKNFVKRLLNDPYQKRHDIIVNGRPGSGKTLLAVSILMMAFNQRKSCLLALRNNRLQAVLKQIFDTVTPGLSGLMLYFEPRNGIGIAQFPGHVDVLICDETQRMKQPTIQRALSKADISVIFLDESQLLNPPEEGTVKNFVDASRSLGRTPHIMQLPSLLRCAGGQSYSDWVDTLLETPSNINRLQNMATRWNSVYELIFSPSIDFLICELRKKREQGNKVALVASFTESPGYLGSPSHPDNLRIGYPLTSGFELYKDNDISISWLMSPSDYRDFWINGKCNDLDRVASIYGCQGFEADYVGVIWGRDLLYRNGKWILGDPNHCYDTIDKLVLGKIPNRRWNVNALQLVLNRYRIFLTRGIKGSIIFCEDEDTRKYLIDLGKKIK